METEKEVCPVCLDEKSLEGAALVKLTPCGHGAHIGCIDEMMSISASMACPVCRTTIEGFDGAPSFFRAKYSIQGKNDILYLHRFCFLLESTLRRVETKELIVRSFNFGRVTICSFLVVSYALGDHEKLEELYSAGMNRLPRFYRDETGSMIRDDMSFIEKLEQLLKMMDSVKDTKIRLFSIRSRCDRLCLVLNRLVSDYREHGPGFFFDNLILFLAVLIVSVIINTGYI